MSAPHAHVPSVLASRAALSLPPRPLPPPRPAVPWLASAVPVVGALGFWAFTGSIFALWFALLGPLIAAAGIVDGLRTRRRAQRDAERAAAQARASLTDRLDSAHAAERADLRVRHPDVAGYLARRDQIWRAVPERAGVIVIGAGAVESATRVTVGADAHPDDIAFADSAREVHDAPVVASLGTGVAVVGPEPLARATARALVLQLALAHPPGDIGIDAADPDDGWARRLPHRAGAPVRVVLGRAGDALAPADVAIVSARPGEPLPPRCGTVLTLTAIGAARAEIGADRHRVAVEAVGAHQAAMIADELAERARAAAPPEDDAPVLLADVRASERRRSRAALPVVIGRARGADYALDLVRDGPHAVVTGMTGAGKSELLVSWVLALCAAYRTEDVAFLLADFKGGTAFDALSALPHVTGVITDLDEATARRAIGSLRAEIRHREGVLARAGVRDVAEVALARLVIVIDEFAALRETQPELEALFADIAARGRALGMHLIVGTQRAAGVVRDALLANCALRICLRVADRLDSRAVIGTDAAADLSGADDGRGVALVRRGSDAQPTRVRIALSAADDLTAAIPDAGDAPRATWLPPLPAHVALGSLTDGLPGLVLGLVDDPERQRQAPWRLAPGDRGLLVVGGPGQGKSTALRTLAAQVAPSLRHWIGDDAERAWDAIVQWSPVTAPAGTVVFADDLDLLAARLPDDHARELASAFERLVREAGARGIPVVASASRLSAVAGRVADLFARRVVLRTAGRAEHVAAGGEASGFALCTMPGRGVVDGLAVQIAVAAGAAPDTVGASAPLWSPSSALSGFVARASQTTPRERWERSGVRLRAVEEPGEAAVTGGEPVVIVGTPDQWLSRPRLLERVRATGALVVDAACERELRMLTGGRSLPPYAAPGRGRAWLFRGDEPPQRVTVDPAAGR